MSRQNVEDALEEAISDSPDMDWRPRDAVRVIMERLCDIGLVLADNVSVLGPNEPGAFVGDQWFGDQANRTRVTHEWGGRRWIEQVLP
jgi:hypothetical protein